MIRKHLPTIAYSGAGLYLLTASTPRLVAHLAWGIGLYFLARAVDAHTHRT